MISFFSGFRQDRASRGDEHPPEQQLPDVSSGSAGPLQIGHGRGLAGDHVVLQEGPGRALRHEERGCWRSGRMWN